jgi:hypothetical protein
MSKSIVVNILPTLEQREIQKSEISAYGQVDVGNSHRTYIDIGEERIEISETLKQLEKKLLED